MNMIFIACGNELITISKNAVKPIPRVKEIVMHKGIQYRVHAVEHRLPDKSGYGADYNIAIYLALD